MTEETRYRQAAAALPAGTGGDQLLRRVAGHGGWWLVLLGGASVSGAAAQVLLPAAIGHVLDSALRGASASRSLTYCGVLVAVIVTASAAVQLAGGLASCTATAWLRRLLAGHALACGPGLLAGHSPGDIVSRIVGGTADAGSAPGSAVLAVTAVIAPAGSMVALGLIDPWLATAFVAGLPLIALVLRRLVRDSASVSTVYQQAQGEIAARLLDALAGARTITAAGTFAAEERRILAPLGALRAAGDASWRVQARAAAQGTILVPILQVIVLAVAGLELARHRITPGDLLAASQYAVIAVGIGASLGQLNRLGRARGGSRRAAELLAWPRVSHGQLSLGSGPGELRFRAVTAGSVLRSLDLVIPGGAAVAVVGASGSGKSVLAALAGRLLDPDEGEVELDGCPLPWLTRRTLRTSIVYAFERPVLFGDTPAEAIGFGTGSVSEETVLAAAAASHAAAFVTRLPGGFLSSLTERPLSGGEVQRLGLARAFAHAAGARLLIFDDATSSLDTATEMLIARAIMLGSQTRLIIAHRASTAARADLVAWLADGGVRALAPHHELWDDPSYRALFGC